MNEEVDAISRLIDVAQFERRAEGSSWKVDPPVGSMRSKFRLTPEHGGMQPMSTEPQTSDVLKFVIHLTESGQACHTPGLFEAHDWIAGLCSWAAHQPTLTPARVAAVVADAPVAVYLS